MRGKPELVVGQGRRKRGSGHGQVREESPVRIYPGFIYELKKHNLLPVLPDTNKMGDGELFLMFYFCCRSLLQMLAARALYHRGWRFNVKWQVWLMSYPSCNTDGIIYFFYFDPYRWCLKMLPTKSPDGSMSGGEGVVKVGDLELCDPLTSIVMCELNQKPCGGEPCSREGIHALVGAAGMCPGQQAYLMACKMSGLMREVGLMADVEGEDVKAMLAMEESYREDFSSPARKHLCKSSLLSHLADGDSFRHALAHTTPSKHQAKPEWSARRKLLSFHLLNTGKGKADTCL